MTYHGRLTIHHKINYEKAKKEFEKKKKES